jgi:hypothetical protein
MKRIIFHRLALGKEKGTEINNPKSAIISTQAKLD